MTSKYESLNDDQLRQELSKRNLDTSGSRQTMIERLDGSDNTQSGAQSGTQSDDSQTHQAENQEAEAGEGDHGTQEDADRSGQRPAPGDPREPEKDPSDLLSKDSEIRDRDPNETP